jgi:hypothetical protein
VTAGNISAWLVCDVTPLGVPSGRRSSFRLGASRFHTSLRQICLGALGSNLVRGAVVPGLDTWWAPLHRLRQLCRVDLFGLTTSQRREPEAQMPLPVSTTPFLRPTRWTDPSSRHTMEPRNACLAWPRSFRFREGGRVPDTSAACARRECRSIQ